MIRFVVALLAALASTSTPADETCQPTLRFESGESGVRLRPHGNELVSCTLDETGYGESLGTWLREISPAALEWISLGRLVVHPWLSLALVRAAAHDARWNAARGRPREGGPNAYVAGVLGDGPLRDRLQAPLDGTGYRVVGVSVEKVLVGRAGELLDAPPDPEALLPFDAQTWLRVTRGQ